MQFNPAKCQTMNISRVSPQTKYYELCGEILTTVTSAKYLGVTISDDLEWHNQVCSMAKSANSTLHLIARNLHNCTRSTRALAYTSLVRPKMEYCASVWDPYTKKDIETLERINRKAARVVYNKSYRDKEVSPTKLIADLGWKTLAERREPHVAAPHHDLQDRQRPDRYPTHASFQTHQRRYKRTQQEIPGVRGRS